MSEIEVLKWCNFVSLEEIALTGNDKFTDGPFGSRLQVSDYTNSGIPIIRLQNLGEGKFIDKNWKFTSLKKFKELERHAAFPGNVVIAKMAEPVARASIISPIFEKYLVAADCIKLQVDESKALPKFVSFMINSPQIRKEAIEKSQGVTRLRINLREVRKLQIPLPPIETQKKIVTKLDYILGQLEEKKKRYLEIRNRNKKRIENIYEQINGEIITKYFESQEVKDNSIYQKFEDTCILNPSKSELVNFDDNMEVSFVPMKAVDDIEGVIKTPEIRHLREVKKGYTYFRENDVIFAKITPCMENGKSAIGKNLKNKLGFGSTEFHVLRPKDNVLAEWLYYFVRQNKFRKHAANVMSGSAGQQRVPISFIQSYVIPIPSIKIQKKIIEEIKNARKSVLQIQDNIQPLFNKLKNSDEYMRKLNNSILDKAFSGKLVN